MGSDSSTNLWITLYNIKIHNSLCWAFIVFHCKFWRIPDILDVLRMSSECSCLFCRVMMHTYACMLHDIWWTQALLKIMPFYAARKHTRHHYLFHQYNNMHRLIITILTLTAKIHYHDFIIVIYIFNLKNCWFVNLT